MSGSDKSAESPRSASQQRETPNGSQGAAPGNHEGGLLGAVVIPTKQLTGQLEAAAVTQEAQTEQPDPYELRDLAAQENMALWAMWMFVAAVATFLVTSFGTLLIWRQVKLTREAVEDTGKATKAMERQNEIAEQAQRPWLAVKLKEFGPIVLEPGGHFFASYKLSVENTGQSPAVGIVDYITISRIESGAEGRERFISEAMELLPVMSSALAPGESDEIVCPKQYIQAIEVDGEGLHEDKTLPSFIVGVVYQNPRDGIPHCTALNIQAGQILHRQGSQIRNPVKVTILRKIMT